MVAALGDKLNEALRKKGEDINTFVWKFPKDRENQNSQQSVKLVDCSQEQLQQFYDHCESMLRNDDKLSPGRYNVLALIKSQKDKIGAELLLREMQSEDKNFTRFALSEAINEVIDNNRNKGIIVDAEVSTFGQYVNTPLSTKYNKLSLQLISDACNDKLGVFDNSHITKSFLLKRGVWFDRDDIKTLKTYALKNGINNTVSKLDIARQYLRLKDYHILKQNSRGLTVEELRQMLILRPAKFADLTTTQLEILRYKVLLDLERNVRDHIEKWEALISQIKKVAKAKKFSLSLKRE
jgi:hypothetical protein